MSGNNNRGFTLIELMIAVAVIAILAAVAFPSYQDSVRKTRRADAKAALERVAALQERWFTENNSYTSDPVDLGGTAGGIPSSEGHYNITIANAGGCISGAYISCFQLTAETVNGDPQDEDTDCEKFTLNELGQRAATKKGGAVNTNCW